MADQELINLPATTTPADGDLLYTVVDPSGTPLDKKITLGALKDNFAKFSNGVCAVPTFTDNGNGTVTLGSGDYCLSPSADGSGHITKYTIAGQLLTLTDLEVNYIVADYNSGSPIVHVITDVTLINETTVIPVYTVFRNGTVLHRQNWDSLAYALANKLNKSIVKTQRYRRESGLTVSEYGTRNLNLTSGIIYTGAVENILSAIATATDNAYFWYHNAGVWTSSVIAQYNNTQYDNGTNLATLSGGRYAVNWIFRGVESQKHLYIVLGTGDYTLAQAEAASVPALPTAISSHAVLVAKLIVAKSAATATSISSAFDATFSYATPSSHSDLLNLSADDHPQYFKKAGDSMTGAINEAKGVDIASASSIDIGAGTGNIIDITGTTTITALGTVQAGTRRVLRFTGALTLTYNATSLILPTLANITTVAGDTATFISLGSGNWVCTQYQRKDGSPLFGVLPASTDTLTNKRIEPRIVSAASYTTDTGTSLSVATADEFIITAQAGALLFNAPGGTPVQGQKLIIRIKDNGTARALTYNSVFRAIGVALPTTTVLSKTLYMGFIYNATDTKWDLVAVAQEA